MSLKKAQLKIALIFGGSAMGGRVPTNPEDLGYHVDPLRLLSNTDLVPFDTCHSLVMATGIRQISGLRPQSTLGCVVSNRSKGDTDII